MTYMGHHSSRIVRYRRYRPSCIRICILDTFSANFYWWYLYLSIWNIQKIQPLVYLYLRYISKVSSPTLVIFWSSHKLLTQIASRRNSAAPPVPCQIFFLFFFAAVNLLTNFGVAVTNETFLTLGLIVAVPACACEFGFGICTMPRLHTGWLICAWTWVW